MTKTVDYFLSPVSPWTYLGHERFLAMCRNYNARINVRPCDLSGKIFPVSGGLPRRSDGRPVRCRRENTSALE